MDLAKKNEVSGYVARIAKQEGFAIWDKALIKTTVGHSGVTANSANSSVTDTIIYIPLVMENTNNVNGFIYAKLNGSISLQLHRANDYASYGFGNVADSTGNAERLALQIIVLDNTVFGYTRFKLEDKRLFKNVTLPTISTDSVVRFLEIRNIDGNITTNAGVANTEIASGRWEAGTITHCTQTTELPVLAGAISPGHSSTTWTCTTTVQYYFVSDDNDDDPGQNGNPTSGGGGSGGGAGPRDSIQCNPQPLLDNGFLPCPRGNTTGWMPVLEEDDLSWFEATEDYEIKVPSDDLGPCNNAIIDSVLNQTNSTIKMIKDLFSESAKFNLTFKIDSTLQQGVGGKTNQTTEFAQRDNIFYGKLVKLNVLIRLNPTFLNGSSKGIKISIAATVMHEMIHAYFLYRQADATNDTAKERKLTEDFGFLKVWDPNAPLSSYGPYSHHQQMAMSYVDKLAAALKEFYLINDSDLNSLRNSSYPFLTIDEYYKAMAWSGLTGIQNHTGAITKAWETFQNDNPNKAAAYKFIISAEEKGTPDAPSQIKCP